VLGRALTAQGNAAAGGEKFRGALENCTDYAQISSVGEQIVAAVGAEKALELLSGLGSGAKVPKVHVQLALATLENQIGRYDAALQRLAALEPLVVKNTPEQTLRELQQASALTRTKRYVEAQKVYEHLMESNPRNASAINNLAYLLVEYLHDTKEGLRLAQRAKDLAPYSEEVNDTIAWATYKNGSTEEAIRILRQSVDHRRTASNCYHLAFILSRSNGNRQEVLDLLDSARTLAGEERDVEFLPLSEALYQQQTKP
jgi:tetratricopeptide (TPR) repeat protein